MSEITVVGLDLAKRVFQVHGADRQGRPVLRKRLRRGQVLDFFANLSPCLIGMEACAGSHYWGRELQALGHEVRLIPPQYVKPYVKTNKNDATDAEAICEALTRPTMRFTALKSAEQQSVLMLHRTRELLVRQRTMLINALRGHCAEFGIIAAQGLSRAGELIKLIEDAADSRLPDLARQVLQCLTSQIRSIQGEIASIEKKLLAWHTSCAASRRLAEIPGVGLITATAVVASVGNATQFRSARQFAAWLGLVPQQHSSGGKERLGHISKRGDGYIRRLLVHGARAHLSWSRRKKQIRSAWLTGLLARRPTNVVLLAMANKTARIAWAMLSRGERYQEMIAATA
jgi:transposase